MMMRILLLLSAALIVGYSRLAAAQDEPIAVADWPRTTVCLPEDPDRIPLADSFSGLIVTAASDGIRGLRASSGTTYILGYRDHFRSFADMGSVSPDGRWFVYPTGTSERHTRHVTDDRYYLYDQLHFVDTLTGRRAFSVSVDGSSSSVSGNSYFYRLGMRRGWLGTGHYIAPGQGYGPNERPVIDVAAQTASLYSGALGGHFLAWGTLSPDGQFVAYEDALYAVDTGAIVRAPMAEPLFLRDGRALLTHDKTTGIVERIGLPDHQTEGRWTLSAQSELWETSESGRWLVVRESAPEWSVLLIDTVDELVIALCAESDDAALLSAVISPDETRAAALTTGGRAHIRAMICI